VDPNGPGSISEFELVAGGLVRACLRRAGLPDGVLSGMRPRVLTLVLCTWAPLLMLSALQGQAWGGGAGLPFLLDVEAHVRFLFAAPLLILAEFAERRRLPSLLRAFLVRGLVPQASRARFDSAVASAARARNSVLAESLVLAAVYGLGILVVWRHYLVLDAATWYAKPTPQGTVLTPAGIWYGLVSVPIVQFMLLRWYWRMLVWSTLLWRISRIALRLVPAHPDRYGGLGFLEGTGLVFTLLAAAHGALIAGPIADRILFAGASLPQFGAEIAGMVLVVLVIVLGPLLFFTPQLSAAKHEGLLEYGGLAERYVRGFEAKWLPRDAAGDEALLGSPDIQSQADLAASYDVVRSMGITPISIETARPLAIATLAPFLPLMLTLIPLNELLLRLLGIER
jgi:hypothetical protein